MHYPAYDKVIGAIYDAAARPQDWAEALEHVADYVGGSGAMLAYSDFKRQEGTIVIGRLREDLSQLYVENYTSNPLSEAIARQRVVAPVLGSMLADQAILRRSPMHADILHPQRIADQAMVGVQSLLGNDRSGGFSITLTERQAERAPAVLRKLGRLTPHLSRATELALEIARHRDGTSQLGSLLEALPAAAILLDRRGLMIGANGRAEDLLRNADGVTVGTDRRLHAVLPQDDRRLRGLLAQAAAVVGGSNDHYRQAIKLARPSGLPSYLAVITPLPPSSFALRELIDDTARALLQLVDPIDQAQQGGEALRQAFGLTSAEARVATLVGSGLGAPQVAAALGLTVNTVRTHIAHCFEKTGVRSQVALARLMASIADP